MTIGEFYYPDGLGQLSGDLFVTTKPWILSAEVIYLSSVIGDDNNEGFAPSRPKATLSAAISAAQVGGTIVLAPDHDETLTATQTISLEGLIITAGGASGGSPTAQLKINAAAASLLLVNADYVQIRNILFPTSVQANTASRIVLGDMSNIPDSTVIHGCRFETTTLDGNANIEIFNGNNIDLVESEFVVTETDATATMLANAIVAQEQTNEDGLFISNCTFDGGTAGYASGVAALLGVLVGCVIEGISLLNGASVTIETGSTGRVNVATSTMGGRVDFSGENGLNNQYLHNGFGELTGDPLLTTPRWWVSGQIIYVSSVVGDDSNTGLERSAPKKTLRAAESASADYGFIVLSADHNETLTTAVTISRIGLVITAAGSSSGQPTAMLRVNASDESILKSSTRFVEVRNILFATSVQSNAAVRVEIGNADSEISADDFLLKNCRFECTGNDQAASASVDLGDRVTVDGCLFVVTGTGSVRPSAGLVIADFTNEGFTVTDTVLDGGAIGFASGNGFNSTVATTTAFLAEGMSLLNGADMTINGGSSLTGRVNTPITSGSARVVFT